jgi:hypothetical protein
MNMARYAWTIGFVTIVSATALHSPPLQAQARLVTDAKAETRAKVAERADEKAVFLRDKSAAEAAAKRLNGTYELSKAIASGDIEAVRTLMIRNGAPSLLRILPYKKPPMGPFPEPGEWLRKGKGPKGTITMTSSYPPPSITGGLTLSF